MLLHTRVSHPLFRMKWIAAAHSILTFPLLFAFSLYNEAQVQVLAASRDSSKIGSSMVHATVAGALLVNCTTSSRVPFMPHNKTPHGGHNQALAYPP